MNIEHDSDIRVASIAKVRESENSSEEEDSQEAADGEDGTTEVQQDQDMSRLLEAAARDQEDSTEG